MKRKGVVSHVAVLMGFARIVTGYMNSHAMSLYEETLGLNSPPGMEM
jgi:hypothetical protein